MAKRSLDPQNDIRLPQVDKILRHPLLKNFAQTVRREIIAASVRQQLSILRERAQNQNETHTAENKDQITTESVAISTKNEIEKLLAGGIRRVINGTGVILSTNLGRAPLSAFAVDRLTQALSSYCNLEFDLDDGERGERTEQLSAMLKLLTGAGSSIVVNNCAAAVMLAVQALAKDRQVIVSRGELIEIGGSFRLPDVISASGGQLKEVGTTNRTRLSDYKGAISENTGLIIKCHRSNYQITGFTEETDCAELAALAKSSNIPLAYDLGGGCLIDLDNYGLAPEPKVQDTLAAGCDLVMYSGDKLLGGPQAGIISGNAQYVQKLRRSPVYRALRADKLVLALLETVLSQYLLVDGAANLPVFALAALQNSEIEKRVHLFIGRTKEKLTALQLRAIPMTSTMGGGSLPGESLPSFGLAINADVSDSRLAKLLRYSQPPIISTITNGLVQLDFRTLRAEDEEDLEKALLAINELLLHRA